MNFLHLTHLKNLNSILKYGLLPSYIQSDHHWKMFKKRGLKERKCVYMWNAETYKNEKYLMDMIYCKMYIHPRNKIFDIRYNQILKENYNNWNDSNLYINFKKFGDKLYGDDGRYVVLEIDSSKIDYIGDWIHSQEPNEDSLSTTVVMDDKYAHEDKKVYISDAVVNIKNIKIVEGINVRVYDNKKLGFSFKKILEIT